MSRSFSQIVVKVYLNGVRRESTDDVEFHSLDLVVFMMWPVETLSELQKTVQKNMRLSEHTPMIQMAYKFFAVLPERSCRYRVFWLINDKHVRVMFASHGRILADQVMDLYVQILDTQIATPGAGPSNPELEVHGPITADLVDVVPLDEHIREIESDGEDLGDSDGGSSGLDNNDPDFRFVNRGQSIPDAGSRCNGGGSVADIGGGSDDYNLDEGIELKVGHKFCSRDAVHMAVKNYSIWRAAEYKLLESDSMKYHCV
ncbi:hypothetical protein PIB30_046232 [Stylosanthes scabra]|uniref:Transposase MuDR plant domain-containing protein n=1 Tax=Stylosanthes scabra TaxID=79078 RepID=A0ABU6TG35_9FABA|nr:hypothetical protein [Stylosanthes scabra]